jgi:hypothetical protein
LGEVGGEWGAGAKQAAEKGMITSEIPEKHTSAAEATIDSNGLIPGINPRPTAGTSFFAVCKAYEDFGGLIVGVKTLTYQSRHVARTSLYAGCKAVLCRPFSA